MKKMKKLIMLRGFTLFASLVLLNLMASLVYADLYDQLVGVCQQIKNLVPIVALLMFFTAGLIYAAGQIMGAETRARANVWATAMLVGGIIGLIIAASAPWLLAVFSQATIGSGVSSVIPSTATC
ncbi:MAG: hypothetical protein QXP42_04430 [Candidatus Micrarchaeia archaeon]